MAGVVAVLATPFASQAQRSAGKVWRVGHLAPGDRVTAMMDGFHAGLREGGYVVGRDIVIEERFTAATPEQLLAAARELVALSVDDIHSGGTLASR